MMRRSVRFNQFILAIALPGVAIACSPQSGDPITTNKQRTFADGELYLSEFHYDNVGTDVGEAIEVTGMAGTNLSEYSVVLYNGSNGSVYGTFVLSGVLADQAEGLGTSVLTLPSNGLQNGSPDGIALVRGGTVLEFLSYEGSFTATAGPALGLVSTDIGVEETSSSPEAESLQLVVNGDSASWTGPLAHTFGQLNAAPNDDNDDDQPAELGLCGDSSTAIPTIQGPAFASPLVGQAVEFEGIVVGDFQGSGKLGGFFVQSEVPDADPATSEGIFVFEGAELLEVSLGQKVRVTGTVSEYFGLTEVNATGIVNCGTGALPEPSLVSLPISNLAQLESLEGMRVTAHDLIAVETYDLGRYGEVSLANERLFNPTNGNALSAAENASRRILLDDGRDAQNLEPVAYLGAEGTLRLGDRLASIDAVLTYSFGSFRLQPLDFEGVEFVRDNARTSAPAEVGGDVRVASLNVLNYFTTLNERGANSPVELERQRAKLVSTIVALDADVLGLMEVENNDTSSGEPAALDDLVASVNAALGESIYARAPDPATTGSDAIRTALIYKPAKVDTLALSLSDTNAIHPRPPLAQTFSYQGHVFSVVVNHFKSKGSCPDSATDENADFGQGCWNILRSEQAEALLDFVEELKSLSGSDDVLLIGDLNSYQAEAPILALQAGGLTNLIANLPEQEQYSYVFNGEAGVLDYALSTPQLKVTGTSIWHINADEPRLLDYNTEFNPSSAYESHAYRSSDHDPVIVGLSWVDEPHTLLATLLNTAELYANEARLNRLQRLQWTALLEGAKASFERGFKEQTSRPYLARFYLSATMLKLRLFEERVENFARRGLISQAQALDLLAQSRALRGLI